jgi:cytochrome P450
MSNSNAPDTPPSSRTTRVFKVSTDFYKAPYFYEAFGFSTSLATITDPHRHKSLRTVVAPMFTGSSVDGMADQVYQMVCKATGIMAVRSQQGAQGLNVMHFLRCITVSRARGNHNLWEADATS